MGSRFKGVDRRLVNLLTCVLYNNPERMGSVDSSWNGPGDSTMCPVSCTDISDNHKRMGSRQNHYFGQGPAESTDQHPALKDRVWMEELTKDPVNLLTNVLH